MHSFTKTPPMVIGGVFVFGTLVLIKSFLNKECGDFLPKVAFGTMILFLSLGLFRSAEVSKSANAVNRDFAGKKIIFYGQVASESDKRLNFSQYVLENERIGRVLVKTDLYPEYFYGDILKITGTVLEPESQIGDADFDYKNYLAKDDIYFIVKHPQIEFIRRGDKNLLFYLLTVKASFVEKINKILPEPQASLLSALLVGAKRALPEDLTSALKKTGTSHIVAISGYNISIISVMILNFLGYLLLPRRLIFWLVAAVILLFTLMTGAEASAVGAAIMGGLLMISRREGRFYDVTNAVVLAAAIMLFINPRLLRYDVGFELSFLATMGLIYIAPYFQERFSKLPNFLSFRDNLTATVSAQIATFPVIFFVFGVFSSVAVLANVLILPAIPMTMLFGFLGGLAGFVSLKLGAILISPAYLFLSYQAWLIKTLAMIPFASL